MTRLRFDMVVVTRLSCCGSKTNTTYVRKIQAPPPPYHHHHLSLSQSNCSRVLIQRLDYQVFPPAPMELSTSLAWANSMAITPSLHFSQPKSVFLTYNKKSSIRVFCVNNNNNNNAENSSSNQSQEVCNASSSSSYTTLLYVAPALVPLWLSIRVFCVNNNNDANGSSNQPQEGKPMIVSITGATGFIGKRLVQRLHQDSHRVRVLTRSRSKAQLVFPANDFPGIIIAEEPEWKNCIQGSNAVVNLAGTPISKRWTSEIKKDIKQSRINVTSKVVDLINNSQDDARPTVLVSATAVGYYGTSEVEVFNEQSPSGNDYLAEVCREWESTALKVNKDVRLARIRIGVVLGKDGGALAKMVPLFKLFAGGPLGSGRQWFSWIHLDDIVNLIYEAISNPSYEGVINGTAPNPVRMAELCENLGNILGRPSWLPVPDFALKAVLGEGASVVLEGQRVLPVRAKELGFSFKYTYVKDALQAIVSA